MGVYTTIDPATGEQSATYPEISDAELNDSSGAARGYRSGGPAVEQRQPC
jgi:succinate-semialdehyde dehydrogenase/glutarate-semialdehyde dehydrogenase